MNTETEPAATIGGITLASLTAAVVAVLVILRAFSLYDVTPDQYAAITGAVAAFWFLAVPMIVAIRAKVYAPATVRDIKETLVAEDPNTPLSEEATVALAA